MKKTIALALALLTLVLSLTGCSFGKYVRGNLHYNLNWTAMQTIYAKVESDHIVFDKNDVTLDFYYGLYETNEVETLEQIREHYHGSSFKSELHDGEYAWESVYAIFLSNNEELVFKENDIGASIKCDDRVNAKLFNYIDFIESFDVNYGYINSALDLIYNHSEKITIPVELLNSSNNSVYIHIFRLIYLPEADYLINSDYEHYVLGIKYILIGDMVVLR